MVNLLETPRVIVFFFYYMIAFDSVFHVLDRDKLRSLGNKILSKGIARLKLRNDHLLVVVSKRPRSTNVSCL